MKKPPATHPTPEKLAAYSQGRLPSAEHAAVEAHVAGCDSCCRRLEAQPGDSLADLVRAAGAPAGAETDPGLRGVVSTAGTQLPPELVDHPRYRVLGLLGVGGMGAVYKAEHKMMERTVALKVINKGLVDNPKSVERFRREVKTAAKLTHPNIVAAHDADQAGDVHFLVMEFVEGQSLAQIVEKRGRLPVMNSCHYIRQAALGLQHAHEQGMVHRDLKPQNLMLTRKGQVKVLDFGLARLASETGPAAAALTHENAVVGTPDYISPEQATDARQADIRADIYSLGCTLYYLLTGRVPFPEGTVMQKVLAHIEKKPQPATELRPDLPDGLPQVLDRMLAKDPAQRYQTPAEVAKALEPFTKPGGPPKPAAAPAAAEADSALTFNTAVLAAQTPRPKKKPAAPVKRRMLLYAGVGAALVVSLGLAAWAVFRVQTSTGTLVIKTDDPDVQIVVKQDGTQVKIVDRNTGKEVELQAGVYELELKGGQPGLKLSTDRFTLSRNGRLVVEVAREVAVAPPASPPVVPTPPPTVKTPPLAKPPEPARPPEQGEPASGAAGLIRPLEGAQALVAGLAFSPDGSKVVACTNGNSNNAMHNAVRLWDTATGQMLAAWEEPKTLFFGIAFAPDGRTILSCGEDKVVRLYDAETHQYVGPFAQVPFKTNSVVFTPDGSKVILAGPYGKVQLWDVAERKPLRSFEGITWSVLSAAVSGDGKRLVACGSTEKADRGAPPPEGYYVHVWDFDTGKELYRLGPQAKKLNRVAISPDGSRALSCGDDNLLRLWDLTTGKELRQMTTPSQPFSVAFSPDGHRALLGVYDATALLLNADQLQLIDIFNHPSNNVRAVAFARDGTRAVTGTGAGDIRLWRLPPPITPISPPANPETTASTIPTSPPAKPETAEPRTPLPRPAKPETVVPEAMYESMLGFYKNNGTPIPFINLSVPNGSNLVNDDVKGQMRGKISLGDIGYTGTGFIQITQDGTYEFNTNFGSVKLDGRELGFGRKLGGLALKKGTYEIKVADSNHGQSYVAPAKISIRLKGSDTTVPIYNRGSVIQKLLKTTTLTEVSGLDPDSAKLSKTGK